MDWIKKNYDQALLLFVSLVLLGVSVFLLLKALSFDDTFESLRGQVPHSTKLPALELEPVQRANSMLASPPLWSGSGGSLFVARKYIIKDGQPMEIGGDSKIPIRPPVPNDWFEKNNLEILNDSVLDEDPDGDGFSNLDEWKGMTGDGKEPTNPQDKNSHPPYSTKLRLVKAIQSPFRLLFASYDGDPKKPEGMTFQINTLDLRQPSQFKKLKEPIDGTKFIIESFSSRKEVNPGTGAENDVSELTLKNSETGDTITMVLGKVVNSPDSYAQFKNTIDGSQFAVKKDKTFTLKQEPDITYKLIDIKDTEAVIENSKTGKRITVPKD